MTALGDDIGSSAVELARSLWAELGVAGAPRRHEGQALDLEPLIIFTACCASADAALRARTVDWCVINNRYLSSFRLHHFVRQAHETTRGAAQRFVATVEAETKRRKGKGRAIPSVVPDLRRPALIQLRLRAMVGVSARAEILKLLLADPERPYTASSLVARAGYGKGGLAQALDMLTMAGITSVEPAGNKLVFRLTHPAEIAQALNGLPPVFPDWRAIFKITEDALRYAQTAPREPSARVAPAAALARELRQDLRTVPGAVRPPAISGPASIERFDRWVRSFLAGQAGGDGLQAHAPEVSYTVHRLLLGGWIATVREPGQQPRPVALSDTPELRPERRAHRRLRTDDVGAAADVIESMLLDIRARDLRRSQGSLVSRQSVWDSLLPPIARDFASELLRPMQKGQSATYTEEFLQDWFTNRRRRYTATA